MKKIFETETFTSFRFFYIQQFFENKNFYINEFGKFSQNAIFKFTTFELAESLGK